MLFFLSVFEQGRAGEAEEDRVRQDGFHGVVEIAGLRAVALVHEHVDVALGLEVGGHRLLDLGEELLDVAALVPAFLAAELVDERAEQPGLGLVELVDEVGARFRAVDVLVDALEDLLDLLVQLGAVGDDEDARAGHVLADPLREPHHGEALSGALCVPDNPALAALHVVLGGAHAEILVVAAELLGARVEGDEVVDQLQEAGLPEELQEGSIQRIAPHRAVVRFGEVLAVLGISGAPARAFFFPDEVIFLGGQDGAVTEAFAVVAGQHVLDGGEERLDELLFLVVEVLADALGDGHAGALELQDGERDAVDVEHEVGALDVGCRVGGLDRDLLGDGEVVAFGVLPVDEPDGLVLCARARGDLHAVAELFVDGAVAVVEVEAGVAGDLHQLAHGAADEGVAILALVIFFFAGEEEVFQLVMADVLVVAVAQVAERLVAEVVEEQADDAALGFPLWVSDGAHTRRVLPVRSSCIMPCLRRRVFSRRCSRAAISASMSERTAAMAVCSSPDGNETFNDRNACLERFFMLPLVPVAAAAMRRRCGGELNRYASHRAQISASCRNRVIHRRSGTNRFRCSFST
jgi:hypothetical protein